MIIAPKDRSEHYYDAKGNADNANKERPRPSTPLLDQPPVVRLRISSSEVGEHLHAM